MARTRLQCFWFSALAGLLDLLAGPAFPTAAQEMTATPAATPAASPVATPTAEGGPAAEALSSEEELVRRFAPVMYLKWQPGPCSTEGEQFLPAPVDVVFGDDKVVLWRTPPLTVDEVGIEGSHLFGLDNSHYIDLPGHPRTPGCDYEEHFKQLMGDQRPVIYAHIARQADEPGLAIQYWFFYYFNEFNDKHEGDWEMIQLLFDDANTPMEALLYGPTRVAYAQHSGGEPANWTDARVDKEGERPVVYVASGSHASFYGPGIWLGWGKDGAGLGCDVTTGPTDRIDPEVRLIPAEITGPDDPFAWAMFQGRWGERDTWVYNGPNGPNLNQRWTEPVTWQNSVTAGSLRLQSAEALGPQPTAIFCELAAAGSDLLTLSRPYPWLVGGGLLAALTMAALCVAGAWPILRAAWALYREHARFFLVLSGILVPFTIGFNGFLYVLNRDARLGQLLGITEDSVSVQVAAAAALLLQQWLLMLVVAPATIAAVGAIQTGGEPSPGAAFRVARARFWSIIKVELLTTVLVILMAITIVGIPWAVMWSVRWILATQVVVLEGKTGRAALRASSNLVKHHWWRTLVTNAVLTFVAAAVGPIAGLALLIGLNVSQDITSGVSATLYAIAYPIATIGVTLLYFRLQAAPARAEATVAPVTATPPATAPGGVAPEPA